MAQLPDGVKLTWLGHATFLLETGDAVHTHRPVGAEQPIVSRRTQRLGVTGRDAHHARPLRSHRRRRRDRLSDLAPGRGDHRDGDLARVEGCRERHRNEQGWDGRSRRREGTHGACGSFLRDQRWRSGHLRRRCAGFVVELADGFKLYHAGDTAVFSDMALIGRLLEPDIALCCRSATTTRWAPGRPRRRSGSWT